MFPIVDCCISIIALIFLLAVMAFFFSEDFYKWCSVIFFILGLYCVLALFVRCYVFYNTTQTTINELNEELARKNSEIDGLYDELEYYKRSMK